MPTKWNPKILYVLLGIIPLSANKIHAQEGQPSTEGVSQTASASDTEDPADARDEEKVLQTKNRERVLEEDERATDNEEEGQAADDPNHRHHHGHYGHHHAWKGKIHPFFSPFVSTVFFVTGVNFMDMESLNSRLENAGFSDTQDPFLTFGAQLDLRFGRLVVGGEAHWLKNVAGESEKDDVRFSWKGSYGLFHLGLDALQIGGLSVYPMVGIGMGEIRLKIAEESGASFDDVLQDPGREVRLTQRGLLLDASLGIDYRFTIMEREKHTSYFTVGVRGGYLFAPYSGDFSMSAGEISDGPDFGITGPYIALNLGFSGKRER